MKIPSVLRVGLTYVSVFTFAVVVPLATKQLLSHSVGPATIFAVFVIVAPVGFFILGALHGTRVLCVHLFGLATAVLITALQYPYHASMNPLRQVPYLWINKILCLYLLGTLVALFFAARPKRQRGSL
jgi:hypothetical protein